MNSARRREPPIRTPRLGWFEFCLLAVAACAFCALAVPPIGVDVLQAIYPSPEWDARSHAISLIALGYALCCAALAFSSWSLARRGTSIHRAAAAALRRGASRLVGQCGRELSSAGSYSLWLIGVMAIGALLRIRFLNQPMRYDESYTFLHYVQPPLAHAFLYDAPNNHVLHTLLVRAATSALGDHPVVIRLPAFLAGLASIPLAYLLCRRLLGEREGLLAASLVAIAPFLVLYDTMARGYSLVALLSLCLALVGARLAAEPSPARCLLAASIAALGMWVMPSFLLAAAGLYLWIVINAVGRSQHWQREFGHLVVSSIAWCAGLTFVVYTPVILTMNGVHTLLSNRFVRGLPWAGFRQRLPAHLERAAADLSRGIPAAGLVAAALLAIVGLIALVAKRNWLALTLLPCLLTGAAIVLLAKHSIPYSRTWIFVLPFACVLIDCGFAVVGKNLPLTARRWQTLVYTAILLGAACFAATIGRRDLIASYDDTGSFPEGPQVAEFLAQRMQPGDALHTQIPANAPLEFYLQQRGLPIDAAPTVARVPQAFFVVDSRHFRLADLTGAPVVKVFQTGKAQVYIARQLD